LTRVSAARRPPRSSSISKPPIYSSSGFVPWAKMATVIANVAFKVNLRRRRTNCPKGRRRISHPPSHLGRSLTRVSAARRPPRSSSISKPPIYSSSGFVPWPKMAMVIANVAFKVNLRRHRTNCPKDRRRISHPPSHLGRSLTKVPAARTPPRSSPISKPPVESSAGFVPRAKLATVIANVAF